MKPEQRDVNQRSKRPYHKPEVVQIPLRPDEAVLGNCKTPNVTGPSAPNCGGGANCMSIGS